MHILSVFERGLFIVLMDFVLSCCDCHRDETIVCESAGTNMPSPVKHSQIVIGVIQAQIKEEKSD